MKKLNQDYIRVFSVSALLTLMLVGNPALSLAQNDHIFSAHNDLEADVIKRMAHENATYAMTSQEGSVDLMLTMNSVVIQFSDRFLEILDNEIRREAEKEESVLAEVITSMVSSGVNSLLNHALEIPLHEIRQIYYEDGKLFIVDYDGEEIFGELEIDDVYIMEDFSRREARRFVSEAEKLMI